MVGYFKALYLRLRLFLQPLMRFLWSLLQVLNVLLSFFVVGIVVYGIGFQMEDHTLSVLGFFKWTFLLFFIELLLNFVSGFFSINPPKYKYLKLLFLFILAYVGAVWLLPPHLMQTYPFIRVVCHVYVLYSVVLIQAIVKLSVTLTASLHSRLSPSWIFVGSFAFLILIGSGLLILPRATTVPIRYIDALFTAVSAVCVTGLTTVDVSSTFTLMGKSVIGFLIQLGGIGIMTFTSFFGLFFAGKQSSQNKMLIKNLVDPDKGVGQIFKTLWYIIFVTIVVELVGAYAIFVSINGDSWADWSFAVFHAISAFCNAGFSTISGGLTNSSVSANYGLHSVIALLVILGGLGFPIIFNVSRWLIHVANNFFRWLLGKKHQYIHIPHVLTVNTLIVLFVTVFLLIGGTIVFYISEYHNTLQGVSPLGKIATAFFMSVTPRTAGFSTFNMSGLMPITVLWMIMLMWIGASPMSTGGGVKTTTIGIAFLNIWHTLRGRNHIEIRKRRISEITVNRAFIIIFGSILVICIGLMLLAWFEPQVPLMALLFETVSAFSTVGLSLDITPTLGDASRVVLICLMFVGRVGLISILSCIIKTKSYLNYEYPSESIPIN